MNMNDYQKATRALAVYPREKGVEYCTLGLGSEIGEIQGVLKRVLRDDNGVWTPERVRELDDEAGDALWYLARLVGEAGLTLEGVARRNLKKLEGRKARGTLKGIGGDR